MFVGPPSEMALAGQLLQLHKAVYGLADAPLHGYHALHGALLPLAARTRPFDPAMAPVFRCSERIALVSPALCCQFCLRKVLLCSPRQTGESTPDHGVHGRVSFHTRAAAKKKST